MLMRRSFKKLATGFAVAATTSLWVFSPVLEVKATPSPSPGEDWAYATNEGPCSLRVSVSDNVVDNTIRIQVVEGNTCPISDKVFLFIQDGRPQPLRLPGILTNQGWVVNLDGVASGDYRVMGISPTPSGIGDSNYIPSRDLGIDQVITIGTSPIPQASAHPQPVVAPPSQVVAPPQRVVTTLDSESKQLLRNFEQWSRNFDQWMRWFQVNIWPQLQPLIRAIEGIKTS